MKRKELLYVFSAFVIAGLILFLFIYSPKNQNKFILADIKIEIKGKVKKKVAVRKDLLTHVKISRYKKSDTLVFLGESIDSVKIDDVFFKNKNSPFFYILRQGEKPRKLKYVLIPKSMLEEEDFPEEWKDSCRNNWKNVVFDD